AHDDAPAEPLREQHGQAIDDRHVTEADRAHPDDVSVEELDALALTEDPRVAHLLVLVDGEASASGEGLRLDPLRRPGHRRASYHAGVPFENTSGAVHDALSPYVAHRDE